VVSEFQLQMVVAEVSNPGPNARMVKGVADADGIQPQFWLRNSQYDALADAGKVVMRGSVVGFRRAAKAGELETEYYNAERQETVPLVFPRQRFNITVSAGVAVVAPSAESLKMVDAFENEREMRREDSQVVIL
jgi:hypothetical protein